MIELRLHFPLNTEGDYDTTFIRNAPCVPTVGALIDTPWGIYRVGPRIQYDYHQNNGECRVHINLENI